MRTGCRILDLAADEAFDVIYSLLCDDFLGVVILGHTKEGRPVPHVLDRDDVRRGVDAHLSQSQGPDHSDRDTWGLRPEHQEGNVGAFGSET